DIDEAYQIATTAADKSINYVFLGCPHVTLPEFRQIAKTLEGKKINPEVTLIISTNRQFFLSAQDMGYVETIEKAGGIVVQDMCIAFSGTQVSGSIATDSIKAAFFYTGFSSKTKRRVWLGNIRECIEAAISGKWNGRS
ncbi:MAG TPA: DUF521 domain-containing protein, partial [Candidatus Atribacteria bacterium]|nr:DUF521 domain-containing protein [Candidatus Atribacteria bacterium]